MKQKYKEQVGTRRVGFLYFGEFYGSYSDEVHDK
jgi:hypothetical protein